MPDQRSDGIDLFCGARGWEARAHRSLGLDLLGVEHWEPACLTSEAAGLRVLRADIAEVDPLTLASEIGADGIVVGSPPCPTFSAAGRGSGKHLTDVILRCARDLAAGDDTRERARSEAYDVLLPIALEAERKRARKANRAPDEGKAQASARRDAIMSVLVVEPLRFALALHPRAVVLEQVVAVLPIWRVLGDLLAAFGYSWWAGILEAERYGVPQTRERAVLIARRDGVAAHPPAPTHHRFVPNEPRPVAEESLFGTVLPWVSMAEALGFGMTERPCVTLTANGSRQGGPDPLDGGSGARATLKTERERGAWLVSGQSVNGGERAEREQDEPAVTITGRADLNGWAEERPAPTVVSTRRSKDGMLIGRQMAEGEGENVGGWGYERPATNVNGDARISRPGRHDPAESGSQQRGAVRVTVQEAAILQSFPPDWPWQGSRTAQFTQVGNAVPPLLGEAILRTVMPRDRWVPPTPTIPLR